MTSEHDSPNPYQSPENTLEAAVIEAASGGWDFAYRKRRLLVFLLVLAGFSGFLSGLLPEESAASRGLDLVSGLMGAILILLWCEVDREERQLVRWRFFVPMMVLCPGPAIMMPTYLLVTRGLGGFAAIAKAIVFAVLITVVGFVVCALALLLSGEELWPIV